MFLKDKKNFKNKILKEEKGFLIIELLISLFIINLLLTGIFNLLGLNMQTIYSNFDRQQEQEKLRILNDNLLKELQFATDINITEIEDSILFSYTEYDGTVVRISFEEDGLYEYINNEKIFVTSGYAYEEDYPPVYIENNGLIRFNFFADKTNSLLYFSIKPRLLES